MTQSRRLLITAGLPYANGDIHIGHLIEYLLPDFWVRYHRMRGREALYICADDTHGTPIMLNAQKQGITPDELVDRYYQRHQDDFTAFEIQFDSYWTTHSQENRQLSHQIYQSMKDNDLLERRNIEQQYCEHDKMFLPDRFVVGACPKCGSAEQNGDSCDVCGSTYEPTELKGAHCVLCGKKPVTRSSEHIFFRLDQFQEFLTKWVQKSTPAGVSSKLVTDWLGNDLRNWCISRDEPYFGFEIPGEPGKYFYVWLDAPIGYIASTQKWCERNGKKLEDYWGKDTEVELYHSIGKDIVYFHALFWPAMLKQAGFKPPDQLFVHGMLQLNGEKMSKSKGTFINARTYLKHLDPTYLRYYFACKLNAGQDDMDLNLDDFVSRVNADLIGKITNVASRGAQMLQKRLDGKMGTLDQEGKQLVLSAQKSGERIAELYESRNFAKVMLEIRSIADDANKYFDRYEPWKLIKEDPEKTRVILTTILNLFRLMAIYLKPILPSYVLRVEQLFGESPFTWQSATEIVEGKTLQPFEHLLQRLDPKRIAKMIDETKAQHAAPTKSAKKQAVTEAGNFEEIAGEIQFDDFAKIDLRIAEIVNAEEVEGAKKLLKLTLSIGSETRQVFAGIKSAYDPATLIGRKTVMVANLAPRKMKFGLSEGMVLAAGPGGKDLFILSPDQGATPGQRVM